jgi:hypothetical protein
MLKMNVNPYIINRYEEKSQLLTMQKQSQTNPNYSVFIRVNSWLNSKQSQTNPTCGELVESIKAKIYPPLCLGDLFQLDLDSLFLILRDHRP